MNNNLCEFINSLPDNRRLQGRRHELANIIIIVIMAILSGHQGLKGFTRFARSNQKELEEVLTMRHGIPKYNTIRETLSSIDEKIMAEFFIQWAKGCGHDLIDEFAAIDGKAVRSTLSGGNTQAQSFVAVVSAFGHQSGLVLGVGTYENGKASEAGVVRDLVQKMDTKGIIFTMDALHSQKKRLNVS